MKIKTRDNYFDNLRGFLIICVIIGNSLEYIYPTAVNPHYLILFLYLFHMPLFTLVSGYFCRKSKRSTQEKVVDTMKIYLAAQLFYYFFNKIILGRTLKFQLFYPSWTLWYLLALIVWYVISDYIHDYKKAFILSIIVSLLVGFDGAIGTYASISRIFFFLPFFIAGLAFDKEVFLEKYSKYTMHLGILTCIMLLILFLIKDFTDVELLFEYTDYKFYFDSALYPLFIRVFHYISGFIISGFILLVCSSRKSFFCWFGKNSLVLYLSHAAIVQTLTLKPILKYGNWIQLIFSETFILFVIAVISIMYIKLKSICITIKQNNAIELSES